MSSPAMDEVDSAGHRCIRLTDGNITIDVALDVGPRVMAVSHQDGDNLLAVLPDFALELPNGERSQLWGGHRLWAGPEVPAITYEPENMPVSVTRTPNGVGVTRSTRSMHGIGKSITVTLDRGRATIAHTLTNRGEGPLSCAPWAITQFPVGGNALLPLGRGDDNEYQADRSLVLWPYTNWHDPRLSIEDDSVAVMSDGGQPLKLGTALTRGWLAYSREGQLFVKSARHRPHAAYVDHGASGQVFAGPSFLELETLGPMATLRPGESTTHEEEWIVRATEPGISPAEVAALVDEALNAERAR